MTKERKYDLQECLIDYAVRIINLSDLFTSIETAKKNRDKYGIFTWILGVPCWLLDIEKGGERQSACKPPGYKEL